MKSSCDDDFKWLNCAQTVTCQGWDSRHDLRPDQGQTNVFNTIAEDGETIIRHILEGSYPGNSTVSHTTLFILDNTDDVQALLLLTA